MKTDNKANKPLEEWSMKDLLDFYNRLVPDKPATPKTFATRGKLADRVNHILATSPEIIAQMAAEEEWYQAEQAKATEQHIEQCLEVIEDVPPTPKKPTVRDIAERLILDPAGFPYKVIVDMVNTEIECNITVGCVSWYANKLRKAGVDVPARIKSAKPLSEG